MKSYWGLHRWGEFKFGELVSVAFINQKNRANTTGHLLLEITLAGRTLYLADQYLEVGSNRYEGLVADWGGIEQMRNVESGFIRAGDASITLLNAKMNFQTTQKFSDLLADYFFENRAARVLQWFDGLSYADCEIIFDGFIDKISFTESEVKMHLANRDSKIIKLPIKYITKKDFSSAPPNSVGKPIPMAYGDLTAVDEIKGLFALSPMILTNPANGTYKFCDREVYSNYGLGILDRWPDYYKYYPETDNYAKAIDKHGIDKYNGEAYLGTDITGKLTMHLKTEGSLNTVTIDNIVDDDDSNYIEITAGDVLALKAGQLPNAGAIPAGASDAIEIMLIYGPTNPSSGTVATIRYYNPNYDDGAGGYGTAQNISGTGTDGDSDWFDFGTDKNAHGVAGDQSDKESAWQWQELTNYQWVIEPASGVTSIRIYGVYLIFNDFNIIPRI